MTYVAQEHDRALSFWTNAWTSPNHKAYVAVMVHFEQNGESMCLLLDLVEVATSHSGRNLAAAFVKILTDFGIGHKVCMLWCSSLRGHLPCATGANRQIEPKFFVAVTLTLIRVEKF